MKKNKKSNSSKSSKKSAVPEPQTPDLVAAMTKLVERLEGLERKMDQVLGRVSNLPSEIRNASQGFRSQPQPNHQSQQHRHDSHPHSFSNSGQESQSGRKMFQAICADCQKNCEVPFKPGDRPVYCKECFAIRKAGHRPQDPNRGSAIAHLQKKTFKPEPIDYTPPPFSKKAGGAALQSKPKKKKR